MDEEVGVKNERVDDIPLILAQMERMGIVVDGRRITWGERRLIITSLQHAKRAEAGLQRRLEYTRLITKFSKNSLNRNSVHFT